MSTAIPYSHRAHGAPYPVHVQGTWSPHLSHWLWLVKWILATPHYLILLFLWVAFLLVSIVAFFAILITGSYPRPLFDFNVRVLRWNWRMAYYTHGALATDQYPPFTLDEVEDYPAHLHVDYPEHLSRGLVLVKWWLLAIPHYIILAFIVGGAATATSQVTESDWLWEAGLIGVLVLFTGVILLFTGAYPKGLHDLLLGLNRWVIRVSAYAGLMTDKYPPFRLDLGGDEDMSLAPTAPTAG